VPTKCLVVIAGFRRGTDRRIMEAYRGPIEESPLAPWGVQLAGIFPRTRACELCTRASAPRVAPRRRCTDVIGTRLRSRGTRAFYRVRIPAASREAATDICGKLRSRRRVRVLKS